MAKVSSNELSHANKFGMAEFIREGASARAQCARCLRTRMQNLVRPGWRMTSDTDGWFYRYLVVMIMRTIGVWTFSAAKRHNG